MAEYERIFLSRTTKEWNIIEKRIQEVGRHSLHSYINSRISLLEKEYGSCPECVCFGGLKETKKFYITPDKYEILSLINEKTGIPASTIVNKLIIEPLLIIP